MDVTQEISILSEAINSDPENYFSYLQRGKLYYRSGDFGKALNDFNSAIKCNLECIEASQLINMVNEILEFRNTDIYNP